MSLNCKKGDIAIVVRAPNAPEFLGRILTCVSLVPTGYTCKRYPCKSKRFGLVTASQPTWVTDIIIDGTPVGLWDSVLRPINGYPEKEETKEELTA